MERVNLVPPALGKPLAPYSHGVLSRQPEAIIQTAGQVGIRPDGTAAAGIEAQLEQIYLNLEAILRDGGMSFADVTAVRTYLTDADHVPAHRAAFRQRFETINPVSTAVIVKSLVSPDLLVEVEIVAMR